MLLSFPLSLPSQVTNWFQELYLHSVQLVFLCEINPAHHGRGRLPPGWKRIGADEFQLAMAPGWTIRNHEVKRVWPTAPRYDTAKAFRLYFQVASGWVGVQVCG